MQIWWNSFSQYFHPFLSILSWHCLWFSRVIHLFDEFLHLTQLYEAVRILQWNGAPSVKPYWPARAMITQHHGTVKNPTQTLTRSHSPALRSICFQRELHMMYFLSLLVMRSITTAVNMLQIIFFTAAFAFYLILMKPHIWLLTYFPALTHLRHASTLTALT